MEAIAEASGLVGSSGLRFMRSPRHILSATGRIDILSAGWQCGPTLRDSTTRSFDELGLLKERDRELVNGLRSSVSAKNGRFISLSIQGSSPFTAEMLRRRDEPGIAVHHYAAPQTVSWMTKMHGGRRIRLWSLGSRAWTTMRHQAERCIVTPADAPLFRAYDLNQPQDPLGMMLVDLQDWLGCIVEELPPAHGPMVLGVDLSSGYAMTAAVGYWPETGRLEGFCASRLSRPAFSRTYGRRWGSLS